MKSIATVEFVEAKPEALARVACEDAAVPPRKIVDNRSVGLSALMEAAFHF